MRSNKAISGLLLRLCGIFCVSNGYDLSIDDSQYWADAVVELVEHRTTEEDFVRILRPFVVPVG
jgi:prophage maintenance system killer protein